MSRGVLCVMLTDHCSSVALYWKDILHDNLESAHPRSLHIRKGAEAEVECWVVGIVHACARGGFPVLDFCVF